MNTTKYGLIVFTKHKIADRVLTHCCKHMSVVNELVCRKIKIIRELRPNE
jgi:hypothetical protein